MVQSIAIKITIVQKGTQCHAIVNDAVVFEGDSLGDAVGKALKEIERHVGALERMDIEIKREP